MQPTQNLVWVLVGRLCSAGGLRWWASISHVCVCLRGFPALVSDCLCMLKHHVYNISGSARLLITHSGNSVAFD